MITVDEAINIIRQKVQPLATQELALLDAAGLLLAEDLLAPEDLPRFAQSAMDGYAFCFQDLQQGTELPVSGEVAAGDPVVSPLDRGTAMRIFTGAPIPPGADTVVMQEKVERNGHGILIRDDSLEMGINVRLIGSEIKSGELALPKGSLLTPGAIGLAASMGMVSLPVVPAPKVTLLITGKELVPPGHHLASGQVYDSNSFALAAALGRLHVPVVEELPVLDTLEHVTTCLQQALVHSDLVLLTGGVSVGDYDFVAAASRQCGVETVFHKVAQKPGKPLLFGTCGCKIVFGLPGNPGSVLTCFYQYVVPAIGRLMGQQLEGRVVHLPLAAPVEKKAGLTHFVKGRMHGNEVMPLAAQESFRMRSFAAADCLIELEMQSENLPKGSMVKVHLLPV